MSSILSKYLLNGQQASTVRMGRILVPRPILALDSGRAVYDGNNLGFKLSTRFHSTTSLGNNPYTPRTRPSSRSWGTCFKYPPKGRYYSGRVFSTNSSNLKQGPPNRWRIAKYTSLALVTLFGALCYTNPLRMERVPESGRWRRISITPEAEAKLGEDAYNSVLSQFKNDILPEDHPVTRHVRRVVASIIEANSLGSIVSAEEGVVGHPASNDQDGEVEKTRQREWRLAVIDNERIMNTTANSGGIIVFTGLLHVCKDEHGLAAVLGHEIAHVVARHTAERYTKAKDVILFPLRFISRKDRDPWNFDQIMSTSLHEQELEADKIGLRLSARACFNPQAAIEVNQRLAVLEKKLRLLHSDFKPTHPTSKERIEQLISLLPEAYGIMEKSPRCTSNQDDFEAFRAVTLSR